MKAPLRSLQVVVLALVWLAATPAAVQAAAPRLSFDVRIWPNSNRLVREGDVAAHLVLRAGQSPRLLIAFPAGNSGVGVWFAAAPAGVSWTLRGPAHVIYGRDARGRILRGLSQDLSVAAADLEIRQAVLSSIRVLRDYEHLGTVPAQVVAVPDVQDRAIQWSRDRLDGAAGYRLTLEVTHGELREGHLRAAGDGTIGLRISGLTGETPLTPLAGAELLSAAAGSPPATRNTLTFLAYREKLLAGSWRFDTYFGRDTLLAVRLLMPALSPMAIEAALASVLTRLSPTGEVAHEEDVGERAVLDHLERDGSRSAVPVYDYKMIDGSYLLAPVASAWLMHDPRARARVAGFLAGAAAGAGESATRGAALLRNLRLVLKSAAPFAEAPDTAHLIALKEGYAVGDWRDSEGGLGGGRYPYDVNAVLVPAALAAAAELADSGLLSPYETAEDRALLARAASMAQVWRARAPPLFEVEIDPVTAAHAIEAYARAQSVPAQAALAGLEKGPLGFHALALDASGAPIPVMHSDEGFALLFGELDAERIKRITMLMAPFPGGLMTDAGMLVANPTFCSPTLQGQFSRNAYHGTVVWSWQQAMFAAGLARQLERQDLPHAVRAQLLWAQRTLWTAINDTQSMNDSELWSWAYTGGRYRVAPFGAAAADVDESNAAQLWSTVYLALRAPSASVVRYGTVR
jgi:hypothetical protein